MSNGGEPIPLSASKGGARILLDDTSIPGKAIHSNPVDSGTNHVVQNILIGNPNSSQVSMWVVIVGPDAPAPTDRSQMVRIDIPPTAEGTDVRLFYTPFILAPGYSYHVSCMLQPGNLPPYLYGYANSYVAQGVLGYGGLIQKEEVALADINASVWVTLPFGENLLTSPINVTQDAQNNRFSVNAPGVWYISSYGVFTTAKTGSDRRIFARFFNETDGAPITPAPWPVDIENQNNNAQWSFSSLFEVPSALVGKFLRVELGGSTDNFTGLQLAKAGVTAIRISPTI